VLALTSSSIPAYPNLKEANVPLYLTRFSYTPETWNAMVERPEDRRTMAQEIIESVGGKLHGFWYAFGQYDGYTLWEAPDNVKMASVAVALASRGAIQSQDTVVLLTVEGTLEALRGAAKVPYRRPAQSE
jgi:uncharacterized protein with GYD domain